MTQSFDSLLECCVNEFWYAIESCLSESTRSTDAPAAATDDGYEPLLQDSLTSTDGKRFYPTYIPGQLCHSKQTFDSWEEHYGTLRECCEERFSWDIEECCNSLDMGGC